MHDRDRQTRDGDGKGAICLCCCRAIGDGDDAYGSLQVRVLLSVEDDMTWFLQCLSE